MNNYMDHYDGIFFELIGGFHGMILLILNTLYLIIL
jgi:hypothetical protein